jgi:hypothetical protein
MRATAGGTQAQSARAASRRAPATAEQVLRLQRTAGNRATRAMIARFDISWGDVWDVVKGPVWRIGDIGGVLGPGGDILVDYGVKELFAKVVLANRAVAKPFVVPDRYVEAVKAYAADAPEDGKILLQALKRKPRYYVGGWILDIQSGAEAMTLDRDVFCVKEPTLDTYVHELVHVKQYDDVGPTKFLSNYFGEAGYEVIRALLAREEIDPFSASTYEKEGYALEKRFKAWRESKKLPEGPP